MPLAEQHFPSSPIDFGESGCIPWVTVICICFNQEYYVEQALQSVILQTHPKVELIVIDNGSHDSSVSRITNFITLHPEIQFIQNPRNLGLNRAFNQGLAIAHGRYVVDLSADDVLFPDRLARQVAFFDELPASYGVVFTNAVYVDALGQSLGLHYPVDTNGRVKIHVPSGDVFQSVLKSYFICTPTMLMRRDVLIELGGYDETLAYEDFDFWVRSSRTYHYAYLDDVLTQKRLLSTSMSAQISHTNTTLLGSTLVVCQKAHTLCHTPDEKTALAHRIRQFIRKAFYAEQFDLATEFGSLLRSLQKLDLISSCVLFLCQLRIPVNSLYRFYLQQSRKKSPTF